MGVCGASQETDTLLPMGVLMPPPLLTHNGSPHLCVHWRHRHLPGNETTLGRSHQQDTRHPAWVCTYRPWKDGENSGEQRGHVTSTSGGQERESRQTVESEERCQGTASASEGGSRRLHEWDELGEAGGWVRPESQALGPPPVRQTAPNSPHPMPRLQREMSLRCGVKEVTEPHGAI